MKTMKTDSTQTRTNNKTAHRAAHRAKPAVATESAVTDPFERSFRIVWPRAEALPAEGLEVFNLDVPHAHGVVMLRKDPLLALRPRMLRLPEFDIANLDDLPTLAFAVSYCNARCLGAAAPDTDVVALNNEAVALRAGLQRDAESLASHGLLIGATIPTAHPAMTQRETAMQLVTLCNVFTEAHDRIDGMTAVTPAQLEHARDVAVRLMSAIAFREEGPATASQLLDARQRVATLFVRAYDQVRRAVQFLRWNDGDADQLAPSLFARHVGTHRGVAPAPADDASTASAPTAAPSPGSGSARTLAALTTPGEVASIPQSDPFTK